MLPYRKIKLLLLLNFIIFCVIVTLKNGNFYGTDLPMKKKLKNGIHLNCPSVLSGDKQAMNEARRWRIPSNQPKLEKIFQSCHSLHNYLQLTDKPNTLEEAQYPIAYSLIVHRNLGQILKLLWSIYFPQNLYCITYDQKSSWILKSFIEKIVNCYPNIITPGKHIKIYWSHFSVLQAAINCMSVLNNHENKWRYMQILSWNDIPLKTNLEMVRIFKILNGSSDTELNPAQLDRVKNPHYFVPKDETASEKFDNDRYKKISSIGGHFFIDKTIIQTPPHNITLYKGSFSATFSREAVKFILTDQKAKDLLQFMKSTYIPDELFWSTLIHNPQLGMPGSYPGKCLDLYKKAGKDKTQISRFDQWEKSECKGMWSHHSCVFGVNDLPYLVTKPHLIVHKLYEEFEPAALHCLLEMLHHRTIIGRTGHVGLNESYYRNMPSVIYQNLSVDGKKKWNCRLDLL